jgi:hypothetical protein
VLALDGRDAGALAAALAFLAGPAGVAPPS